MPISLLESHHFELRVWAKAAFAHLDPEIEYAGDEAIAQRVLRLNLGKHLVPEALGGFRPNVDVRALCVLREELAYRDPACDAVFAVQGLGSHPVLLGGTEDQQREFLFPIASNQTLWAFALTEAEAGSDAAALNTRAESVPDGYRLQGEKKFISNAGVATHYLVFARTAEGKKGISAFVVPAQSEGISVHPQKMLSDHPLGAVTFKDVVVPNRFRIGEEGSGLRLALSTLDVFRTTVGAAAVGMAQRALDEAVTYSRSRRQFGAPLFELPAVQALIADSATELEASRLMVHRAAALKDEGAARVTLESAQAKLFATEAAHRIVDRCLQIHGGNGLLAGTATERIYRAVRALRIYEGASEVQRQVIARQIA